MSKIKKLSESVKTAIQQANQEVVSISKHIIQLNDEKQRYLSAPIARQAVTELVSENIKVIAAEFETNEVEHFIHDCAVFDSKSVRNLRVIRPSLDNLLVSGITGDPSSWKLKPEALIWLLRDVMQDRLNESIKEMEWPQKFNDGITADEREQKLIEIDQQLEDAINHKQSILDEIEGAGGRLIG